MDLADVLLMIFLILFFILMCVWLVVAIVQGVFYIVYQKTDRLRLSRRTYFRTKSACYIFEHQKKDIDVAFLHFKCKGTCYIMGAHGFYKVRKNVLKKLSEEDLTPFEKELMDGMTAECIKRAQEDAAVLDAFLCNAKR